MQKVVTISLAPGNYFVAIEGRDNAEGPYAITTTSVSASPTAAPTHSEPSAVNPTAIIPTEVPTAAPTTAEPITLISIEFAAASHRQVDQDLTSKEYFNRTRREYPNTCTLTNAQQFQASGTDEKQSLLLHCSV